MDDDDLHYQEVLKANEENKSRNIKGGKKHASSSAGVVNSKTNKRRKVDLVHVGRKVDLGRKVTPTHV
jgi:hypothetical protein